MNYNEYNDFFGTPPKIPNAPDSKFSFIYADHWKTQ